MECPKCGSENVHKQGNGTNTRGAYQGIRCMDCKKYSTLYLDKEENLNEHRAERKPSDIMTEDQLRAKYDLSFIVQTALDQLQPGQFLNKEMLLKRCKLSASGAGVSATLNSEQFKGFRGKAKGGELIFGHPTRISTLIEETVLSEI